VQLHLLKFFRLANASIEEVGSEPIDSKQIIGTRGSLSSHIASKFKITPSAYYEQNKWNIIILLKFYINFLAINKYLLDTLCTKFSVIIHTIYVIIIITSVKNTFYCKIFINLV